MPGVHAKFSPSSSERWIECPGSISIMEQYHADRESRGMGEEYSPYAHEGSICHSVAEQCLRENKQASAFLGQEIEEVLITDELSDAIQVYLDDIRGLAKELNTKGGRLEMQLKITDECWGTADSLVWNDTVLAVTDLKMGKGVIVPAIDNPQLQIYGVGALMYLQENHGLTPKEIILRIVQPRTVNPIRPWKRTRAQLIEWYKEVLLPSIEECKAEDAIRNPGESQCRWCAGCAEQAKARISDVARAFKPFTSTPSPAIIGDEKGELTPKDIAAVLEVLPAIDSFISMVKKRGLELAMAGTKIPGHKIVYGRTNRKWITDTEKVASFLKGCDIEAYRDAPLITLTAAEKAIAKKVKQGEILPVKLEDYWTKPTGAKILVSESDTRPEVRDEEQVAQAFAEVVDENPKEEGPSDTGVSPSVEEPKLTALQRMRMKKQERVKTQVDAGEATDPADDVVAGFNDGHPDLATKPEKQPYAVTKPAFPDVVEPSKKTKRYTVLQLGLREGGSTLEEAAQLLGCKVGYISMHLKYLHERDHFGYTLDADGRFTIQKG